MKNLLFVMLFSSAAITNSIAQLPFGGLVVYLQLLEDITEVTIYLEKNNSFELSSPYRRINKGSFENPYARGNFNQYKPLSYGNKNIVPEYILTTAPRKDNAIVGGMMLVTFAVAGISEQDFSNPGQSTVMLSCLVTTAVTFAILQVWNKRKKKEVYPIRDHRP